MTIHAFTQSGLGESPFTISSQRELGPKGNNVFFCEHCGRTITNRHFVKSSDGVVSVVGKDCLKKTGDTQLIDALQASIREAKVTKKNQNIDAKKEEERSVFNGLTKQELIKKIVEEKDLVKESAYDAVFELTVASSLQESNFGLGMLELALKGEVPSSRSVKVISEIEAKALSGARKGSKAYKEALLQAELNANELVSLLESTKTKVDALTHRINELLTKRE